MSLGCVRHSGQFVGLICSICQAAVVEASYDLGGCSRILVVRDVTRHPLGAALLNLRIDHLRHDVQPVGAQAVYIKLGALQSAPKRQPPHDAEDADYQTNATSASQPDQQPVDDEPSHTSTIWGALVRR